MSNLPEILESGPNTLTIGLPGNKRIYFSYKTPIAFFTPRSGLVVRQNDWSVTTGKHLNAIDDGNKANRRARRIKARSQVRA